MRKVILGCALGQCVHIAGLSHFLRLCEEEGYRTINLGPATQVNELLEQIEIIKPEICAVSFRLTPEDFEPLLKELISGVEKLSYKPKLFFGGTPPVADLARRYKNFDQIFDGRETLEETKQRISGKRKTKSKVNYPSTLLERIEYCFPLPLIRHHYGEPDLSRTIKGARKIAKTGILDVLSIGPDQNSQEYFFSPEKMDLTQNGSGGVPLRKKEDLKAIYDASRCGNYPLLRCYSGTNDLIKWADMLIESINIAWGAVPLCWYSALDGRSKKGISEAIAEKQEAISYYAQNKIPVEVNESHQWSLRDAHDSLAVATAYLSAYNAKKFGVETFILQMMFNTPPSTTPQMDLAKMLAKLEVVTSLEDEKFKVLREVRCGIASLPSQPDIAKGHLSASIVYSMLLKPHILHIVGFSEGYKIVTPEILIESCRIGRGAVNLSINCELDFKNDKKILKRKNHLISEAQVILEAIKTIGKDIEDPLISPSNLSRAIEVGILDTPHFKGLKGLKGDVLTSCIDGGWDSIDPNTGKPNSERKRLNNLGIDI
jgi:hypothetical protein